MTHFRDHVDAMLVIGETFTGHRLSDQPCQSWMVRGDRGSAYHFVITWLPGRALIVTGYIGEEIYSGITHLASLDETVRLCREADMDYLSRKSSHRMEFDANETAREIVAHAYRVARRYRDFDWFKSIIDWADLQLSDRSNDPELCASNRKDACRELLGAELCEHTFYSEFEDVDIQHAWPASARWHYEALRTWAGLMARARGEEKLAEARAAKAGETA